MALLAKKSKITQQRSTRYDAFFSDEESPKSHRTRFSDNESFSEEDSYDYDRKPSKTAPGRPRSKNPFADSFEDSPQSRRRYSSSSGSETEEDSRKTLDPTRKTRDLDAERRRKLEAEAEAEAEEKRRKAEAAERRRKAEAEERRKEAEYKKRKEEYRRRKEEERRKVERRRRKEEEEKRSKAKSASKSDDEASFSFGESEDEEEYERKKRERKERERREREKERERRHRHRHRDRERSSRKEGKSSKSKKTEKKAPGVDTIDRLDVTGLFGGAFHHDGPFDACTPHRNKHSKVAPVMAFPIDGPNSTIKGLGPNNTKEHTIDTVLGKTPDESEPLYQTRIEKPKMQYEAPLVQFDAKVKEQPIHGDTTLGLGSSTFLEGAPASNAAKQEEQKFETAQLGRKKSLSRRLLNGNAAPQPRRRSDEDVLKIEGDNKSSLLNRVKSLKVSGRRG